MIDEGSIECCPAFTINSKCGPSGNADVNAAKNILNAATKGGTVVDPFE